MEETHLSLVSESERIEEDIKPISNDESFVHQLTSKFLQKNPTEHILFQKFLDFCRKIWIILCFIGNTYPLARLRIFLRTSDYILFLAFILFNVIFFFTSCSSHCLSNYKR